MHRKRTGRMCTKLLMEVTAEKRRKLEMAEEDNPFLFYARLHLNIILFNKDALLHFFGHRLYSKMF